MGLRMQVTATEPTKTVLVMRLGEVSQAVIRTIRGARFMSARIVRVNSKCGPPDGYWWQGDERQKNAETIPSRISVQDTSRKTDSSVGAS